MLRAAICSRAQRSVASAIRALIAASSTSEEEENGERAMEIEIELITKKEREG